MADEHVTDPTGFGQVPTDVKLALDAQRRAKANPELPQPEQPPPEHTGVPKLGKLVQPKAFYAGTQTPIPDDKLGEALATGQASYAAHAAIHVINPATDERATVRPDQLIPLMKQGWALQNEQDLAETTDRLNTRNEETVDEANRAAFEGGAAQATAAALGWSRGFLGGTIQDWLGRQVFARIAGEDPNTWNDRLEKLEHYNKWTFKGAELGGFAASVVAASGVGKMAEAGEAPGLVSRLVTAPTRAIIGLGEKGEQAAGIGMRALGYTGETAWGRIIARGTAYGVGGAFESAALGADKVLDKAFNTDEGTTTDAALATIWGDSKLGFELSFALGAGAGLLGEVWGKGAAEGTGVVSKMEDNAANNALKNALGNNAKSWRRMEGKETRVGKKLLDLPDGTGTARPKALIKTLKRLLRTNGQQVDKTVAQAEARGATVDGQRVIDKADSLIKEYRASDSGNMQDVADRIEHEIAPLRKKLQAGEQITPTRLLKLRRTYKRLITSWESSPKGVPGEYQKSMKDLYFAADDELRRGVGSVGDEQLLRDFSTANENYSDFKDVLDGAKVEATRLTKNRKYSLSDYLSAGIGTAGGAAVGHPAIGGLAMGEANHLLRLRGRAWAARAVYGMAHIDQRIDKDILHMLNEGRKGLVKEGLKTSAEEMATPTGEPAPVLRRIVPGVTRLTGDEPSVPDDAHFDELMQGLTSMGDPTVRAHALTTGLAPAAQSNPQLALAAANQLDSQIAFLADKAPSPYVRPGEQARVSPGEKAKFMRTVSAMRDPVSVLDKLAHGELDREGLEVLKSQYPSLYQHMRTKMMSAIFYGPPMPYGKRVLIGMAFDFPADKSLEPAYISAIQQQVYTNPQNEQKPGPKPPVQIKGAVASEASPTQRLATGG